jgi:hypothetical protein
MGADGKIHLVGKTEAADFPMTPGTFTLPMSASVVLRVFLPTWDPAPSQFTSLAAFGNYLNRSR